jgi:hypothetical protein
MIFRTLTVDGQQTQAAGRNRQVARPRRGKTQPMTKAGIKIGRSKPPPRKSKANDE